jgi:H+/Cl- antiporter ClcA
MADSVTPQPEGQAAQLTPEQANATIRSRAFLVLLAITAVVGVLVSIASWCFLELVHQIQQEVFTHLPHALGYPHGPPTWWPLPVLAIAGGIVALAIARLPGGGGHIPARGLAAGAPPTPAELPGVLLAGMATISLGLVLGPEAPLLALGSGLAAATIRMARRNAPDQVVTVVAAAGSFAAISFVFSSPLIAAVIIIEVAGIGGPRLPIVMLPGLLAAGIGSLVSLGIGAFTGLSTSAYALQVLELPSFDHLRFANFAWTIALSLAVAIVTFVIMRGGKITLRLVAPRPFVWLPIVALIVAGLAIAFSQISGKTVDDVLFSGQDQLPGLITQAGAYSVGALALLLVCKGVAYSLSLGSFRGGPTFPAIFLGAAAGIMASHLPGFPVTAAVAVGIAASVVSVLKLPLTAVVTATVLTAKAGVTTEPLIIVAAVVAFVATQVIAARADGTEASAVPAPPAGASPGPGSPVPPPAGS